MPLAAAEDNSHALDRANPPGLEGTASDIPFCLHHPKVQDETGASSAIRSAIRWLTMPEPRPPNER